MCRASSEVVSTESTGESTVLADVAAMNARLCRVDAAIGGGEIFPCRSAGKRSGSEIGYFFCFGQFENLSTLKRNNRSAPVFSIMQETIDLSK